MSFWPDPELERVMEHSRKTAEREKRKREHHPSQTGRFVRCFEGVNQRSLGHPNACTFYAVAFVQQVRAVAAAAVSPEFIFMLLQEPGVPLPEVSQHPDPATAVEMFPGLRAVDAAGTPHGDSLVLMPAQLASTLAEQLAPGKATGALIINGTETFGVGVTNDGRVCLFDSHGDSTQTEPSLCIVWETATVADACLGISDFIDERSHMLQEMLGDIIDVVLIKQF